MSASSGDTAMRYTLSSCTPLPCTLSPCTALLLLPVPRLLWPCRIIPAFARLRAIACRGLALAPHAPRAPCQLTPSAPLARAAVPHLHSHARATASPASLTRTASACAACAPASLARVPLAWPVSAPEPSHASARPCHLAPAPPAWILRLAEPHARSP
jgi:hypothetical protein